MIRDQYSVDDEIELLRTAPSPEYEMWNEYVEFCRAWGREQKELLGLQATPDRLPHKKETNRMKAYFLRLAAWLSQGLHCLVLGGSHDMTLSARCYVEHELLGNQRWRLAHQTIDRIFWLLLRQEEHCKSSFHADEEFAQQVLALAKAHQK